MAGLLHLCYKIKTAEKSAVLVAAGQGFEPRQTESESVVLPLHNPAVSAASAVADGDYYIAYSQKSQWEISKSPKFFCAP